MFTGFYGLLFILFIVALLVAFFKYYVIPNGLFDRKGNVIEEPSIERVMLERKKIAAMPPVEVEHILVIGRG